MLLQAYVMEAHLCWQKDEEEASCLANQSAHNWLLHTRLKTGNEITWQIIIFNWFEILVTEVCSKSTIDYFFFQVFVFNLLKKKLPPNNIMLKKWHILNIGLYRFFLIELNY